MIYKIFDNDTGVILSRNPVTVYDDLSVSFSGAPENATAIFDTENASLYRPLTDGACTVPADVLIGAIRVTVVVFDGSACSRRWPCEELFAEKLRDGGTLVFPNDMNLPQRFVELKKENDDIRQSQKRIEERLAELEDRIERLLDGYDLT